MNQERHLLPRAIGPNVEIWAIGDAHGCADLAADVLNEIASTPRQAARRIIVTLGDAIDRGPQNLETLDLWRFADKHAKADHLVSLMGNHEAMLRQGLALTEDGPANPDAQFGAFFLWARNGGSALLDELDIGSFDVEGLKAGLGPERLAYLRCLESHAFFGGLCFVHAGVDPDVALHHFLTEDWRDGLEVENHWAWIRDPFLSAAPQDGHHGFFVVHGHTIPEYERVRDPALQIKRFRLNLDFGSFRTGQIGFARFVANQATIFRS